MDSSTFRVWRPAKVGIPLLIVLSLICGAVISLFLDKMAVSCETIDRSNFESEI